ncbi:MAG: hypothetical protein ABI295_02375 [Xanthomarina sp.]
MFKNLLSKVWHFLGFAKRIYLSNEHKALVIVTNIKLMLESKLAISITNLIPGEWDEKLRLNSIHYLKQTLFVMGCVDAINNSKIEDTIKQLHDKLCDCSRHEKNGYLIKTASLLCARFDDFRLSQSEYDLKVQERYTFNQ